MPPPPAAGRGKKPTKAEIEKRKQEELEKQRQEEERLQQLQEEEEAKLAEERRKEEEEKARIREIENSRFDEERTNLRSILAENEQALQRLAENQLKENEWYRYVSCEKMVDPRNAQQLNSFINVWNEQTGKRPIQEILKECKQAEELLQDIASISTSHTEKPSLLEESRYEEATKSLQKSILDKLDAATLYALKTPEDHMDEEDQNIKVSVKSEEVKFKLWGNVARNPRIKEVKFSGHDQFSVALAKPLVVGSVAIRLLLFTNDFLSSRCRSSQPPVIIEVPEQKEEVVGVQKEESEPSANVLQGSATSITKSTTSVQRRVQSKAGSRVPSAGVDRATSAAVTDAETEASGVEADVETTTEDEEGASRGGSARVANQKLGLGSQAHIGGGLGELGPLAEDNPIACSMVDMLDPEEVDMRNYRSLGGMFCLGLFALPPQPRLAGSWTVQDDGPAEIKSLKYPPEFKAKPPATPAVGAEKQKEDKQPLEMDPDAEAKADAAKKEFISTHMAQISLSIPSGVLFFEEPKLARWDEETASWRTDGFSDFQFEKESSIFTFNTTNFSTYALMQDCYLNTPLASWCLLPVAVNHSVLTLSTSSVDLEIAFKGDTCVLKKAKSNRPVELKPDTSEKKTKKKKDDKQEKYEDPTLPELASVRGRDMTFAALKKALVDVGLDIFPGVDGHKYVSVNEKGKRLEERTHQEMALLSSGFGFQWSRYNEKVRKKEVVIQVCPIPDEGAPPEWSCFLMGETCWKLAMNEDSVEDEFQPKKADNTEVHATLFTTVTNTMATPRTRDLVQSSSPTYVQLVHEFLSAIRPLVYS